MKCSLNDIFITLSEILASYVFLLFPLDPIYCISASTHSPRPQVGVSIQEGYS